MRLIKNVGRDRVIDELRLALASQTSLDVSSPAFSLFAFRELRDPLGTLDGWRMVLRPEERGCAELAKQFIAETCATQGIVNGQLTIHADRGSSMTSKPVAFLMADLGVTKTHSRPHVSDDNPYSESHFKTMKYRPDFPERFGSIEDARSFSRRFVDWYNDEHRHSGLGLLSPSVVHHGLAEETVERRAEVLAAAYLAHPERFVRRPPQPPSVPKEAWINKPKTPDNNTQ